MFLKTVYLSLFVSITSCSTTVYIKETEWCGDMGEHGAACYTTGSPASRELPKDKWDKERLGMVCTNAQAFANWKKAILHFCKKTGDCVYEKNDDGSDF